jgi:ribosomal protein L37E
MITSIYFPNKEFNSKAELYDAIKMDEARIKAFKKAEIIFSHQRGHLSKSSIKLKDNASKALTIEDGYIYPVISTTNYLDSHGDVHINGCFKKTVQEQQGKILYCKDHNISVDTIIAWQSDVEMMVAELPFSELGKEYSGSAECLIFKIEKEALVESESIEDIIDNNRPVQNSIRMQYVNFVTCIDDKRPEYKVEKANWDKYYKMIANKADADLMGYFWAVTELKIRDEGSMVVKGSNDATPILQVPSPEEETKECDSCGEEMNGQYCASCGMPRKKTIAPSVDTQNDIQAAKALKKKQLFIHLTKNN